MSRATRDVALAAILGVEVALLFTGHTWTVGWSIMLLATGYAVAKRVRGLSKMIAALAPYLAVVAGLGLVVQTAGVVVHGDLGRAAGFLPHANTASDTAVALWVLLAVGASGTGCKVTVWRIAVMVGSLVAMLLLFAAGTRSVVIGLMIGLLFSAFARAQRGLRTWLMTVATVGVLGAVLLGAALLRADVGWLLGAFGRGPIYMTAIGISQLSPWVGLGDGAWRTWAPVVEPSLPLSAAGHAHSVPLATLIDGGAIGLAAVLMLFAVLLYALGTRRADGTDVGTEALLVGTVALGVHALVDVTVLYPSVYVPLVLAAATWRCLHGNRVVGMEEAGAP